MTTPTPSPEEHRQTAEALLAKVYEDDYAPMHPYRVDMLNRATVHALLALGPVPAPASPLAEVVDAVSTPEPSRTPPVQTPRKAAAKKTTSKETPK